MRLMSNYAYKDAKGKLTMVPVRYGNMDRQVASILSKNSENIIQSAPFIACYIKDVTFDRSRMNDPTFVSRINIREKETQNNVYIDSQGAGYTVERLMPTPYLAKFAADLWTTNTDQKLQLWEQITVLFNPSLELQSTDNYIDWSSLSLVELADHTFESRTIPQGLETDISISKLEFDCPIWINPPAKVKKLGIITKIVANVFVENVNDINFESLVDNSKQLFSVPVTLGNFELVVLDNAASLIRVKAGTVADATSVTDVQGRVNWLSVLDLYPGKFRAGLSQIRLSKPDNTEIIAYARLNPLDDFSMILDCDQETAPQNTLISG